MEQPKIKFRVTVRVKDGLIIRDTPRSASDGGRAVRTEPVGKVLNAYQIIWVGPIQYAQLVPQNPLKSEWARVAEADNSVVYLDVEELTTPGNESDIVTALNRIAKAIEDLDPNEK